MENEKLAGLLKTARTFVINLKASENIMNYVNRPILLVTTYIRCMRLLPFFKKYKIKLDSG